MPTRKATVATMVREGIHVESDAELRALRQLRAHDKGQASITTIQQEPIRMFGFLRVLAILNDSRFTCRRRSSSKRGVFVVVLIT